MKISFSAFEKQCRALRSELNSVLVEAIDWMHFNNTRYAAHQGLMSGKTGVGRLFFIPFRFAWLLWRAMQMSWLIARCEKIAGPMLERLKKEKIDLVAKSFCVDPKKIPKEGDFYFGELFQKLESQQLKTLLLLGNSKGVFWKEFFENAQTLSPARLPDIALLSKLDPFRIAFLQMGWALSLLWKGIRKQDLLVRPILFWASHDVLRHQTLIAALHDRIGKTVARYWKPKSVLTLFEGQGWENCLVRGVRSNNRDCQWIGYQHTVILARATDVFDRHGSSAERVPNLLLTCGPGTTALLGGSRNGANVIPFGACRLPQKESQRFLPDMEKKTILVLPEGIEEEMLLLFRVALQAAEKLPEFRFIFRCHPLTPFESVSNLLRWDSAFSHNVSISRNRSLTEDLQRGSIVLYRGSSTVMQGVMHGLKPLYFDAGEENIDPLFSVQNSYKRTVSSAEELQWEARSFVGELSRKDLEEWGRLADYVENYAMPVSQKAIDDLGEFVWGSSKI